MLVAQVSASYISAGFLRFSQFRPKRKQPPDDLSELRYGELVTPRYGLTKDL
jgi:hypothetical protein